MELDKNQIKARNMLCLPLDGLASVQEVCRLVEELNPYVRVFKIGKEIFTRFGPDIVKIVKSRGGDVFLDLKFHDIPNTVRGAAQAAAELGVYMFNVHASGGIEMMKAALEGAKKAGPRRPLIVAVTVLTSIDVKMLNNELNVQGSVDDQVIRLARLARAAELDGIVCSAADLAFIKDSFPDDFMYVTPGIKGVSTQAGADQKRVFSPGSAVAAGSSLLVVGRAITSADNKIKATKEILADMAKVL